MLIHLNDLELAAIENALFNKAIAHQGSAHQYRRGGQLAAAETSEDFFLFTKKLEEKFTELRKLKKKESKIVNVSNQN